MLLSSKEEINNSAERKGEMEGILSAFSGSLLVSTVCSQKCITSFLKSLWVGIWVGIVVPFTDKEAEAQKSLTTHLPPYSRATRSSLKLRTPVTYTSGAS